MTKELTKEEWRMFQHVHYIGDFYQAKDGAWWERVIPVSPVPAYAIPMHTYTTPEDGRTAVKPVRGIPDTLN